MERPQAEWLIEFLEKAGKLKSVPRHCITPEGVRETVAGHCWRVSLMAWLLKEELPDVDMEKGNPYVSAARSRRSGNGRYPCI